MSTIIRRLERLEAAFGGRVPAGLITLEWYKAHADTTPIEEWPCSPEERAAIRARVDQAEETLRMWEESEGDYAEQ